MVLTLTDMLSGCQSHLRNDLRWVLPTVPPAAPLEAGYGVRVKPVAQHTRGNAGGNRVSRNIMRYDCVGADNGAIMDNHAAQHDGSLPDPDVVSDLGRAFLLHRLPGWNSPRL